MAGRLFDSLTGFRLAEKYKAIEFLNASPKDVDQPRLRLLIIDALENSYYPGKEIADNDPRIADTRSWLLSALARVSAGDDAATDTVVKHVCEPGEPNLWTRYWALEGLIYSGNGKAAEVAQKVIRSQDKPLVSMLAQAYQASAGNVESQKVINDNLAREDTKWAVLRALRVVPLPSTASALCDLVEKSEYNDETYDSIVALGRLPSTSSFVSQAAQALGAAIVKMRGSPWKDGMRSAAITALGNLRVENSGPLLLEELLDDNPAIVREAARTIEKILGLNTTVNRVVEAATKVGTPTAVDAFARALRWMNREAAAEELEVLMGTGPPAQQEIARSLLSELGGAVAFEKLRARTASMKQYEAVLERAEDRVRDLFEQTVHEAQKGFQLAILMDLIVFGLGIALIVSSATMALFKSGDLAMWAGTGAAGATGILGVLYTLFVGKPRQRISDAVDHLMRVKIIFLAYLRRLHQTDQAYVRLLLDSEKITVDELKQYSEIVGGIMESTGKQLAEAVPPR